LAPSTAAITLSGLIRTTAGRWWSAPSRDYLWILARDKQLPPDIRAQLIRDAQALGLPTDQLVWVTHSRSDG